MVLGIFDMIPGQGHGVTLIGPAPVAGPPVEITVDNSDPGLSGYLYNNFWSTVSHTCCDAWNDDWQYRSNTSGLYTWPLTIAESGTYEVYAHWPIATSGATVPYTLYHDNGPAIVNVDQNANGGQWNLLGSFAFSADDTKIERFGARYPPCRHTIYCGF